jgi:hypothetical protein
MSQNNYSSNVENDAKAYKLIVRARAVELFKICDHEEKGFINKKDIQRMRDATGIGPEVLEDVFDSLDLDKNGFLTLDEFTVGFSSFLGTPLEPDDIHQPESIDYYGNKFQNEQDIEVEEEEEESAFRETMEHLGASHLIERLNFKL